MRFPLLRARKGDRTFIESDPFECTQLDIPASWGGRVRLQVTILSLDGSTKVALSMEWPRCSPLPGPKGLADEVWRTLLSRTPQRTRRAGLAPFNLALREWRGTVSLRKENVPALRRLEPPYALLCIREALAFAYRHLRGRWPSEKDKQLWMYRMHRYTAMMVADEVARLYLGDRKSELGELKFLKEAAPSLRKRIKACWQFTPSGKGARITPRRLALALVDAKFKHVLPELLNVDRCKGIADGQLWSLVMPPEKAERVRALCPTPTVRELRRWSRSQIHESYAADWFLRWWANIVLRPLHSFEMIAAGDDAWPSRVWEALHS